MVSFKLHVICILLTFLIPSLSSGSHGTSSCVNVLSNFCPKITYILTFSSLILTGSTTGMWYVLSSITKPLTLQICLQYFFQLHHPAYLGSIPFLIYLSITCHRQNTPFFFLLLVSSLKKKGHLIFGSHCRANIKSSKIKRIFYIRKTRLFLCFRTATIQGRNCMDIVRQLLELVKCS